MARAVGRALPPTDPDAADALAHRRHPALGCARRSVELFQRRMTERILFGTTKPKVRSAGCMASG